MVTSAVHLSEMVPQSEPIELLKVSYHPEHQAKNFNNRTSSSITITTTTTTTCNTMLYEINDLVASESNHLSNRHRLKSRSRTKIMGEPSELEDDGEKHKEIVKSILAPIQGETITDTLQRQIRCNSHSHVVVVVRCPCCQKEQRQPRSRLIRAHRKWPVVINCANFISFITPIIFIVCSSIVSSSPLKATTPTTATYNSSQTTATPPISSQLSQQPNDTNTNTNHSNEHQQIQSRKGSVNINSSGNKQQQQQQQHSLMSKLRHLSDAITNPKQTLDSYLSSLMERHLFASEELPEEKVSDDGLSRDVKAVIKVLQVAIRAMKDLKSASSYPKKANQQQQPNNNNIGNNKASAATTNSANNQQQQAANAAAVDAANQSGQQILIGHRDFVVDPMAARSSPSSYPSPSLVNNDNNNNNAILPLAPLFAIQTTNPLAQASPMLGYSLAADRGSVGGGNNQWQQEQQQQPVVVHDGNSVLDYGDRPIMMSSSSLSGNHPAPTMSMLAQQLFYNRQQSQAEARHSHSPTSSSSSSSSSNTHKSDNAGSSGGVGAGSSGAVTGPSRLMVGKMLSKTDWNALFVKLAKVFLQYFLDLLLNEMFGTTGASRTFVSTDIDLKQSLKEFLRVASGLPPSNA